MFKLIEPVLVAMFVLLTCVVVRANDGSHDDFVERVRAQVKAQTRAMSGHGLELASEGAGKVVVIMPSAPWAGSLAIRRTDEGLTIEHKEHDVSVDFQAIARKIRKGQIKGVSIEPSKLQILFTDAHGVRWNVKAGATNWEPEAVEHQRHFLPWRGGEVDQFLEFLAAQCALERPAIWSALHGNDSDLSGELVTAMLAPLLIHLPARVEITLQGSAHSVSAMRTAFTLHPEYLLSGGASVINPTQRSVTRRWKVTRN